MIEKTVRRLVPVVDLGKFRDRGWIIVRGYGKDVMMSKPESELTDDELQHRQKRARGG